jgi:intracellular sulfur oxidation DsrE/DsrF family protein
MQEANQSQAREPHYRAVFHTNRAGKAQHDLLLNNIENVLDEFGDQHITVAVVAHGDGIDLLLKQSKLPSERLAKLNERGVQLLACHITMKRQGITPEDLHDFVQIIPSGNAELIRKQYEGWAYIRP